MSLGGSFSCVRRPKRIDWGSLNSAHCSPAADGLKVVHMDAVKELRKAKRYRLSAPAVFEWASQGGDPHGGQGVTRDVNASGVYVFADALPPVGALVHLEILLPKLTGPGARICLTGEGVVFRVEPRGSHGTETSKAGFAASVQFYPEAMDSALSHMETSERAV